MIFYRFNLFDHNLNRLTLFATDNGLPKYKNEFVLSSQIVCLSWLNDLI